MGKKLHVGDLPYGTSDNAHNSTQPHGTIQTARVILDQDKNRAKGFGPTVDKAQPGNEQPWRSGLEYASDYFG